MAKLKVKKSDVWIDMTPMSDVMVLLLTFFMLSANFVKNEVVKVTTPASETMAKVPSIFGERDILKNLQLLPGVKSEGEASSGYQVRGGTAAQNLILLDGATVYNAGHLMGRPEEVMDATDYQPPFNGK